MQIQRSNRIDPHQSRRIDSTTQNSVSQLPPLISKLSLTDRLLPRRNNHHINNRHRILPVEFWRRILCRRSTLLRLRRDCRYFLRLVRSTGRRWEQRIGRCVINIRSPSFPLLHRIRVWRRPRKGTTPRHRQPTERSEISRRGNRFVRSFVVPFILLDCEADLSLR